MTPRARRTAVLLAACALAAPAAARAADDPPPTGGTAAPAPVAGIIATPHVLVGNVGRFRGSFQRRDAGRIVTIERFDSKSGAWTAVTTTRVAADGSYVARWRADVAGQHRMRATLGRRRPRNVDGGAALFAAAAPEEAAMTVYRPAMATWYGPGFYGRTTACGQRMTRRLLGVAHRRLPCGTQVAITYGGKAITVPVVDRGPFAKGRRWDLTAATAQALGFTFTDRIGAVRVG
jgi:rare lipoprotein A